MLCSELAIVGQDARQWPDLPDAKRVPDLGRGEKPGTREGIGRACLGGVDSADAGDVSFFFNECSLLVVGIIC